ncbi:hypothetical protein HY990_05100 [Candidatus Micrarchaeota archaeon]|nr:hypothetical protein [Candidatus Micrarchaeota archaeon]
MTQPKSLCAAPRVIASGRCQESAVNGFTCRSLPQDRLCTVLSPREPSALARIIATFRPIRSETPTWSVDVNPATGERVHRVGSIKLPADLGIPNPVSNDRDSAPYRVSSSVAPFLLRDPNAQLQPNEVIDDEASLAAKRRLAQGRLAQMASYAPGPKVIDVAPDGVEIIATPKQLK